jgi:hypothetical protein
MRTENLPNARDSFDRFFSELREARTDSVNSGSQFVEVTLIPSIENVAKMQAKVNRIREAAKHAEVSNQKKDSAPR